MKPRLCFYALLLAAHLTGCASHRPNAYDAEHRAATYAAHAARAPRPAGLDSTSSVGFPPLAPPPAVHRADSKQSIVNRATDAIGLSTPEGRARRQAVRLAKAAVPRSIGKGAVYAYNSKVTNGGNKPTGPVTQADSGAVVSNAATNSQQQVVPGNGNTLSAKQANPTQEAKGWAAELASPVGKVVAGVIALFVVGTGVYGFVWWKKKKQVTDILA